MTERPGAGVDLKSPSQDNELAGSTSSGPVFVVDAKARCGSQDTQLTQADKGNSLAGDSVAIAPVSTSPALSATSISSRGSNEQDGNTGSNCDHDSASITTGLTCASGGTTSSNNKRKAVTFCECPNRAVATEVVTFKRNSAVSEFAELPEVITRKTKLSQEQQLREGQLISALQAAVAASVHSRKLDPAPNPEVIRLTPPFSAMSATPLATDTDTLHLQRSGSQDASQRGGPLPNVHISRSASAGLSSNSNTGRHGEVSTEQPPIFRMPSPLLLTSSLTPMSKDFGRKQSATEPASISPVIASRNLTGGNNSVVTAPTIVPIAESPAVVQQQPTAEITPLDLGALHGPVGGLHALCLALGCDHPMVYPQDSSDASSEHHSHHDHSYSPSASSRSLSASDSLCHRHCLNAIYKQYLQPRSVLKRREDDAQLKDARARIVLAAITKIVAHRVLRKPMEVLKLNKEGEPVTRFVWVNADATNLCWASYDPGIKRSFFSRLFSRGEQHRDLSSVRRLALGTFVKRREATKMKPRAFPAWRCITIEWAKIDGETPRKTEIVCLNDDSCRHLFMGLQALIPLTRYHISYPRFLWRRARLRALARAYELITRIEDVLARLWRDAREATGRTAKENRLRALIKQRMVHSTTLAADPRLIRIVANVPGPLPSDSSTDDSGESESSKNDALATRTSTDPCIAESFSIMDAIRHIVGDLVRGHPESMKKAGCCLFKVIQDRIAERRSHLEAAAKTAISAGFVCRSAAAANYISSTSSSSSDEDGDISRLRYLDEEDATTLLRERPLTSMRSTRVVHSDLSPPGLDALLASKCVSFSESGSADRSLETKTVQPAPDRSANDVPEAKVSPKAVRRARFDFPDDEEDEASEGKKPSFTRVPTGKQPLSELVDDSFRSDSDTDSGEDPEFPHIADEEDVPTAASAGVSANRFIQPVANSDSSEQKPLSLNVATAAHAEASSAPSPVNESTPESPTQRFSPPKEEEVIARADKFIRFVRTSTGPLLTGFEREFIASVREKALAIAGNSVHGPVQLEESDFDDPEFTYIGRPVPSPLSTGPEPSSPPPPSGVASTVPQSPVLLRAKASQELLQMIQPEPEISEADHRRLSVILTHMLDHAVMLGHHRPTNSQP